MYQRIVVPLDGSKVGEAALPYVEDLVSKMSPEVKVEVTLLQVLALATVPVVSGEAATEVAYTDQQMEQIRNEAMEYLDNTGEALRSKGATVMAKVAIGDASEQIVKFFSSRCIFIERNSVTIFLNTRPLCNKHDI